MTDNEKEATYSVERELSTILLSPNPCAHVVADVFGSTLVLPTPRKFGDLDGVQRYVDAVLDLHSIRSLNMRGRVKVRRRKGTRAAHYEGWGAVIAVPDHGTRWAMNELVILHEIAHHLDDQPGHGPTFRGHYVNLLSVAMAPEVALFIRAGFDRRGLSVQLP